MSKPEFMKARSSARCFRSLVSYSGIYRVEGDFGREHAGEIRGVTFFITIVGAALGPLPFGWSAAHGGYFPVLLGGATLCMLAAVANLTAKRPT